MGKHLIQAFAVDDPDRFAQLLGSCPDVEAAVELLKQMPDGLEGEVLSHLSPDAAGRLLSGLPDELLAGWLGTCSIDAGRRLLVKLGDERSAKLISMMSDRAKRRGLRRITTYPEDTVGALVQVGVMTVPFSATAVEIKQALHEQGGYPDSPVVIVGEDDTVLGVLDLAAFVRNQQDNALASEFCIAVQAVHADAPVDSVIGKEDWSRLSSLPVVDAGDRLVGYLTRSALDRAAGQSSQGNVLLESGYELSLRLIQFLSYMMELIFSRRKGH